MANMQNTLDHLVGNSVAPVIVAFVERPPQTRRSEFGGDKMGDHTRMLVEELVPFLETELPLLKEPRHRGIMGASFGAVAASGGYYIAAGTDAIVCEPTGFTGSIGVIAQVPTLEGTMRILGVNWVTEVADGSPAKDHANNLYRTWDDADRAVLKNLINAAYDRFAEVVTQGRAPLDETNIADVATGAIYTADEALANGLVDQLGYLDDAIAEAETRAGLTPGDAQVTVVRQPGGPLWLELLAEREVAPDTARAEALDLANLSPQKLRSFLDDLTEVRLAYRWPGY